MGILKIQNKGTPEPRQLAGAYLPRQVNSYLSLYALSEEITKSTVIRREIEAWYKRVNKIFPREDLIKPIIYKIKKHWESGKSPHSCLAEFQGELKSQLVQKGISENDIKTILTAFSGKYEKN